MKHKNLKIPRKHNQSHHYQKSVSTSKVQAKCPKCEKMHEINDASIHKFTPRVFCEKCKKSVNLHDFRYEGATIYVQ
jgi:hypothetical protein